MKNINSALVKGSFILLVCFGIFNILNFGFHFFMARYLTLANYGFLSLLLSFFYVIAVFYESVLLIVSKYAARETNLGKLKTIMNKLFRKAERYGFFFFVGYSFLSFLAWIILHVDFWLLELNGLALLFLFFLPITRGILQGQKKFVQFGLSVVFEGFLKLAFGFLFVSFFGWGLYGAIAGLALGGFIVHLFLYYLSVADIRHTEPVSVQFEELYAFAKPAVLTTLVVTLFFSVDIVIARLFFSADDVGAYAVASMIAKAIFWGTQPIGRAMFPLSAEHSEKENQKSVYVTALVVLAIVCFFALVIFYFFPSWLVFIFSGKNLVDATLILFSLGLAMALLSFANIILQYRLSRNNISQRSALTYFGFLVIEFIILALFHKSLETFSTALIVAAAIFLGGVIFLDE